MSAQRTRILVFTRSYLPGYRGGGPIRSIASMVDKLSDEFEFHIVTMDRDFGDVQPYPSVRVDCWNEVGRAHVFYCSRGLRSVRAIERILARTPHDVLYLNSFFDPSFTMLPLLLRRLGLAAKARVVLAPRGEFSAGALGLKQTKKQAYIATVRRLGLYRDVVWQASTDLEASDVVRAMGAAGSSAGFGPVLLARNLAGQGGELGGEQIGRSRISGEPLRLCFLSRISPKKNLDYALRVLARLTIPVKFSIYGPQEDSAHWAECARLIAALPANIEAVYCGSVEHQDVAATLAQHDLFFFPTRGENFGHVIYEALRAGIPVLLSDQTPWRDLERDKVGWALPLSNPSAFAAAIEEAFRWDAAQRAELALRAAACAARIGADADAEDANRQLFRSGDVQPARAPL